MLTKSELSATTPNTQKPAKNTENHDIFENWLFYTHQINHLKSQIDFKFLLIASLIFTYKNFKKNPKKLYLFLREFSIFLPQNSLHHFRFKKTYKLDAKHIFVTQKRYTPCANGLSVKVFLAQRKFYGPNFGAFLENKLHLLWFCIDSPANQLLPSRWDTSLILS